MTTILEIQELDSQKRKFLTDIDNSKENKLLKQFTDVMKEGRIFINNISNASNEMINEYNRIYKKYENNTAKAEIMQKQKVEKSSLDNISNLVNTSNSLASECAILEQQLRELADKSSKLLNDYNLAMEQLKNTKHKVDTLKDIIAKKQDSVQPEIKSINTKIKALESKVDAKEYEKYKTMRDDNIFPVYVHLNGNRCGWCQMELPLSLMEKLKLNGRLPCEECHRIIMLDKK